MMRAFTLVLPPSHPSPEGGKEQIGLTPSPVGGRPGWGLAK